MNLQDRFDLLFELRVFAAAGQLARRVFPLQISGFGHPSTLLFRVRFFEVSLVDGIGAIVPVVRNGRLSVISGQMVPPTAFSRIEGRVV
jgi:hypothetical protein